MIEDLKYLSDLGNGTSGHVVKMLHKPTNAVIAVKVRISFSRFTHSVYVQQFQ